MKLMGTTDGEIEDLSNQTNWGSTWPASTFTEGTTPLLNRQSDAVRLPRRSTNASQAWCELSSCEPML